MIGNPRELRCSDIPDEWKERLKQKACPICGKERKDFDGRHRSTPCCSADCTAKYWDARKTWQHHRNVIYKERNGICAGCGYDLTKYPAWDGDTRLPTSKFIQGREWVLDHIIPIALGGSMWDPKNHQILCEICNKEKTARDLGQIAAAKRLKNLKIPDLNAIMEKLKKSTTQQKLF